MQRVGEARRHGRVAGLSVTDRTIAGLALVARPQPHQRGFPHDAEVRTAQHRDHPVNHLRDTAAADFLVPGKRDHHRPGGRIGSQRLGERQRAGQEALHVCRSPAHQPVTAFCQRKGIDGPCLSVDGYDVTVGGQERPALTIPELRQQTGLGVLLCGDAGHREPRIGQQRFDPRDQRQVRPGRDGRESDQRRKDVFGSVHDPASNTISPSQMVSAAWQASPLSNSPRGSPSSSTTSAAMPTFSAPRSPSAWSAWAPPSV